MELAAEYDVIVVGAGAAGVGVGVMLRELGVERFVLLERDDIGASFDRWPTEMRFITPSFPSNAFGLLDLNAVALNTSPGYGLRRDHPSGAEYATYLRTIATYFQLPVQTGTEVHAVTPWGEDAFLVTTSAGEVRGRFVIWAAGEFQYPWLNPFPGGEYCLHNAQVRSWRDISGDEAFIIGGYESGMDAAVNLAALGKRVHVIGASATWESVEGDPSLALSPYTWERLEHARATGEIELIGEAEVTGVERTMEGYAIHTDNDQTWLTTHPPILATGFIGSLSLVADRFDWHEDGYALLTEQDESTRTPGLFLVGPQVRHDRAIFCFIYKFRQRFAVVAHAIGERLGLDVSALDVYRASGMFLEDFSCCDDECVC